MPAESQAVSFDDIHLKAGDTLQMQPMDLTQPTHYRVRHIGALEGASLLTTLPLFGLEGMWMRPNSKYIFRVLSGDRVHAFVAKVLKPRAHPYPYAHFTYPESVQSRQVRNSPRVELHLDSEAELADGSILPLTLLDLGLHGALAESRIALGEAGATLGLALPIHLSEVDRKLILPATIRSLSEGEPQRYGLEFGDLTGDEALLLHFFIDHLIAEGSTGET